MSSQCLFSTRIARIQIVVSAYRWRSHVTKWRDGLIKCETYIMMPGIGLLSCYSLNNSTIKLAISQALTLSDISLSLLVLFFQRLFFLLQLSHPFPLLFGSDYIPLNFVHLLAMIDDDFLRRNGSLSLRGFLYFSHDWLESRRSFL